MRVAVIFFGIARRLADTIGSIETRVFGANAGQGLHFTRIASLNLVDVIVSPRSGEIGIVPERNEVFLLDADTYLLQRQDDATIAEALAAAQRQPDIYRDDWASVRNHLHQLASLKRAWPLIEQARPGFDRVLFIRPDLFYHDDFPLARIAPLLSAPNAIALPDWGGFRGLNDRLAFAGMEAARHYANRLDLIPDFTAKQPIRPERMLARALFLGGCTAMALPVRATRVRADGRRHPEDFATRIPLPSEPRAFRLVPGRVVPDGLDEAAAAATS